MSTLDWVLSVGGVLLAAYILLIATLMLSGRRTNALVWARFLPHCIILVRRLLADPHVARSPKLLLGAMALYLATPIDLVPDFLPVIGHIDDAIVVALTLRAVARAIGEDRIREHWPGPESSLRIVLRLAARGGSSDAWTARRGAVGRAGSRR